MIRVKITRPIYIRKGPGRNYSELATIYPSGKEIFLDGVETGEAWKGINTWYFKLNNKGEKQYYWGGGTQVLNAPTALSIHSSNPLIINLEIDKIWQKGEYGDQACVAILDTGIDLNNPDLSEAKVEGYNLLDKSNNIGDNDDHGSSCASLIASRNKQNQVGIAPESKLYVIKIANKAFEVNASIYIEAITYAANIPEVDIITLSYGISNPDKAMITDMQNAIDNAIAKGKIVIFSIGNSYLGEPVKGGEYPASCTNTISVGSTDLNNKLMMYSLRYEQLTICCPGSGILSYDKGGRLSRAFEGTSQATAVCSGVIALLISALKKEKQPFSQNLILKLLEKSPKLINNEGLDYRYIRPYEIFTYIKSKLTPIVA